MNYPLIIGIEAAISLLLIIVFLIYRSRVNKKIGSFEERSEDIEKSETRLQDVKYELEDVSEQLRSIKAEILENEETVKKSTEEKKEITVALEKLKTSFEAENKQYQELKNETLGLEQLKKNENDLREQIATFSDRLNQIKNDISSKESEQSELKKQLHEIMGRVDLYSRLDEYTTYGHYEEPDYLYETSARFVEEIKRVREKQKQLIKDKSAVTYPSRIQTDKKILDGQVKLMLAAFNIECDRLIGKVRPSNIPRTLEQIDRLATKIEKSAATLHCGFNLEYVELKYEECKLQYQYTLKKQEEMEEQRLIKEQMREEAKAQKEYERAIAEAEREERMYRKMLEKAKESLEKATGDELIIAQQKIEDLEYRLTEALEKEERAKSLAEQTRRGHVYIISNIGSFGEGIYKIGLTRRLDPIDRVKELGDASVPYRFDVHAIIHSDDSPALEAALHREFKNRRVNAVNFRKEFFRIELPEIRNAAERIVGKDLDFKMTALAEEYFETRRLQEETSLVQ